MPNVRDVYVRLLTELAHGHEASLRSKAQLEDAARQAEQLAKVDTFITESAEVITKLIPEYNKTVPVEEQVADLDEARLKFGYFEGEPLLPDLEAKRAAKLAAAEGRTQ